MNLPVRLIKALNKFLPFVITFLVSIFGIATYIGFSKYKPYEPINPWFQTVLYADVFILLVICVFVVKLFIELYYERKSQSVGSKLHIHLVLLFSFATIIPTLCVAIFSSLFFNTSLNGWFSEPIKNAVQEAENASKAYVVEHNKNVRQDAVSVVMQVRPLVPALVNNTEEFSEIITQVSQNLNLDEVIVFSSEGVVLARSYLTFSLEFEKIPKESFQKAKSGELVVISNKEGDRVRALVRLDPVTESYLYVGKKLDSDVIKHYKETNNAVNIYKKLERNRSQMQIYFLMFFALLTLLLLFTAIWLGMILANSLVSPIRNLIKASDKVASGDFNVQIKSLNTNNELDNLTNSFNVMTAKREMQRENLLSNNRSLIQRRKFIETVLSNIPSGVLRVSGFDNSIILSNLSAEKLFQKSLDNKIISDISMDINNVIENVKKINVSNDLSFDKKTNHQIKIINNGIQKTLNICISPILFDENSDDYIITIDDVSDIIQAQKLSAWSEVARRIAHEIKNPLTPIQLSAERLRRRFLKNVSDDKGKEVFENCLQTIVRQVEHIKNLVSEFSSFSKIPIPTKKEVKLSNIIQDSISLQKNAYENLNIKFINNVDDSTIYADQQQISQMLTNIFQNSINAMQESNVNNMNIKINLELINNNDIVLFIDDNGPGFPKENRGKLLEPYITTRQKGTGLGLAIVSKVSEDHGIKILLDDAPIGGARVGLVFNTLNVGEV